MSVDGIWLGEFKQIQAGIAGAGHKRYIGERYLCRFCGRDSEHATFKKKAHAIPEFLGNHQLILNSECDSCNEHFGNVIEPHLEKYTHPFRTLSGITNKARKTPKHSDEQISGLQFNRHTNNMTVSMMDDDAFKHQADENKVTWEMQRKPFIPYLAHKALCKIAVSVAEERYIHFFEPTLEWLNPHSSREIAIRPAIVIETLMPGVKYSSCVYKLFFRNTNTFPHCLFWIAFGSHSLMTFVPIKQDFRTGVSPKSDLPYILDPRSKEDIIRFGGLSHTQHDFSSKELTSFPHTVNVRFDSIEEISPPH